MVVRTFASLRELRGRSEESCVFPEGTTAAQAYLALGLPSDLPVAFAINQTRVQGATVLEEGDEVVFLPPVGGG